MIFTMNNTEDPFAGERLKLSHFHPRQAALNLRNAWTSWNGYQFAEYYYDTEFEYFCVRNTCGTYDICPMQKYFISGTDAEAMLDRMVIRDVTKLKENRVSYGCWCTDEGRIVDDGTVFKLGPSRFMLACGSPSLAWLKKSAFGYSDVTIVDMSDDIAALPFQGPTTCEVLKKMGLNGRSALLVEREKGPELPCASWISRATNRPKNHICIATSSAAGKSATLLPQCGHRWSRPISRSP